MSARIRTATKSGRASGRSSSAGRARARAAAARPRPADVPGGRGECSGIGVQGSGVRGPRVSPARAATALALARVDCGVGRHFAGLGHRPVRATDAAAANRLSRSSPRRSADERSAASQPEPLRHAANAAPMVALRSPSGARVGECRLITISARAKSPCGWAWMHWARRAGRRRRLPAR